MIRSEDIRDRIRDIDEYLLNKYKENKKIEKRDWRTYEQQLMKRVKGAIRNLEPLIAEATNIKIHRGPGRPTDLDLKQSVTILLIKELIGKSNRNMSSMLDLFSLLSGIEVDYKKVERLYSNYDVTLAIYNLYMLILKEKGVKKVDTCGDGTGYSLSIKKHYASEGCGTELTWVQPISEKVLTCSTNIQANNYVKAISSLWCNLLYTRT